MTNPGNAARQLSRLIEKAAGTALLAEVEVTPKPGLVDLHDQGSHRDMNYGTFVRSTRAITPYFQQMAFLGLGWEAELNTLFSAVRKIGIRAEEAMFTATGGVNTHKGILFSMGVLCGAAGWSLAHDGTFHVNRVLDVCKDMTQEDLEQDFLAIRRRPPRTHGEKLYVNFGVAGIRGEVLNGFPSIRNVSYPFLLRELNKNISQNEARLHTLLKLMTVVEDTNVLIRSDAATLTYVQQKAGFVLSEGGALGPEGLLRLREMNRDFIRRNISPGGCADLLAATIFLAELERLLPQDFTSER